MEQEVLRNQARFEREATVVSSVNEIDAQWKFYRNWQSVESNIVHFQLRHLVGMTSANDVFYCQTHKVMHYNLLSRAKPKPFMDVSGETAGTLPANLGIFPVCTLCAKHGFVAAGGFRGELVMKRVGSQQKFDAALRVTDNENGITNAIDIYESYTGSLSLVLSNNDSAVRLVDASTCLNSSTFEMPWAVNCSAPCPLGKLFCVVGDDSEGVILDSSARGSVVARLRGHADFSFACAWHPDGNIVATGNQDLTTRVYDLRFLRKPLAVLQANIGAVRSLKFSPDGRFLAMAEPADYVSLYDAASGYSRRQTIDFFGELAGICFEPDRSSSLFLSISDVHYGSLIQFRRRCQLGTSP